MNPCRQVDQDLSISHVRKVISDAAVKRQRYNERDQLRFDRFSYNLVYKATALPYYLMLQFTFGACVRLEKSKP